MNKKISFWLIWLLLSLSSIPLLTTGLRINLDTRNLAQVSSGVNGYVSSQSVVPGGQISFTFTSNDGLTYVDFQSAGVNRAGCNMTGATCSGNPMGDGKKCWWRWSCVAVMQSGGYQGTFTSREGKSSTVSYTITGGIGIISPVPTGSSNNGINYYVSPQPVATGQKVAFTFTADSGYTYMIFEPGVGVNNCQLDSVSAKCSDNPTGDGKRCWWRWNCVGASQGSFTGVFNNREGVSRTFSYTIGTEVEPTKIPTIGVLSPTPTTTPVPTTTSKWSGKVELKMAFSGMVNEPKCAVSWPIRVALLNGNELTAVKTVIGERLTGGIYKVVAYFDNLIDPTKTAIFLNGPKHIQTKYGIDNQKSYYPKMGGELDLMLNKVFEFSGFPLMAGDINQDGSINGLDFSIVKSKALIHETVSPGADLASDLDGDCQVNNHDVAVLRLSLEDKQSQLY